jgi:hypothetical protein
MTSIAQSMAWPAAEVAGETDLIGIEGVAGGGGGLARRI